MSGTRDDAARDAWRSRFQRFGHSGVVVAQFCAEEGVSVASFYYWRKKLGAETSHRRLRPFQDTHRRQLMAVRQPMIVRRGAFRPVTIVPPVTLPSAGVSIVLSNGTRIEVGAEHLDALRAVIVEVARAAGGVGRQDRGLENGATSC